jgi:hypothetical protein
LIYIDLSRVNKEKCNYSVPPSGKPHSIDLRYTEKRDEFRLLSYHFLVVNNKSYKDPPIKGRIFLG